MPQVNSLHPHQVMRSGSEDWHRTIFGNYNARVTLGERFLCINFPKYSKDQDAATINLNSNSMQDCMARLRCHFSR